MGRDEGLQSLKSPTRCTLSAHMHDGNSKVTLIESGVEAFSLMIITLPRCGSPCCFPVSWVLWARIVHSDHAPRHAESAPMCLHRISAVESRVVPHSPAGAVPAPHQARWSSRRPRTPTLWRDLRSPAASQQPACTLCRFRSPPEFMGSRGAGPNHLSAPPLQPNAHGQG